MRLSQKQTVLLISAALVITTLIAYEPVRHNGFVTYDDYSYIVNNPQVTSGLSLQSLGQAFTQPHFYMWHPLTTISHILDYQLFGPNPLGHHFVGLLLHIANALLLLWIINNLSGSVWLSVFVAGVFALHPIQVESVAWAAERKTVLSGLFWLLTMAAYIHYARQPRLGRYIVVLLVFGLCIMTKPVVVTLPMALLLLDYWPLERIGGQKTKGASQKVSAVRLIVEKIPLLAMSAFLSVMTFVAQKQGGVVPTLEKMPLDYRAANMFLSYIRYIGKMLWPSGLAVCYPHPRAVLSDAPVVMCAMLFIVLTVLSIYIGRRKKYVAVGWLWYVGTLVPVIGLVQSGAQAMANRYMYIPMLGLLIIIGWAVNDFIVNRPRIRIAATVMGVIVLLSLLILTRMQVRHWQNTLTLFDYALKVTEDNVLAENSYGCALFEEGRVDEAERYLRNAIRISPVFVDARNNLAKVCLKQGKFNEAIEHFNELIRRNEGTAEIYYNLAAALGMQKKYDDAIKYFVKSLELNPNDPDTHKRMGITLLAAGKTEEAIVHFNESLRMKANQAEVYVNLGKANSQLGRYESAIQNWTRALELKPDNTEALNNLGWLLATFGEGTIENANKAIELSQHACELTGYNDPEFLDTLAAAYASGGRFDEAKATAEKALSAARAAGREDLAGEIQKRKKLYEAGQPYREK
jgi:protein O-mannosyl-transferase